MEKQCKTCEFNFDGNCAEYNSLYGYGNKITDYTKCCKSWEAGTEYFTDMMKNAPRFLLEKYNGFKISYEDLLKFCDDYKCGKSVPIDFFNAVKVVYGLSIVDIAVLLDVSFGVVYQAKTRGIPEKRRKQFAKVLCINTELLDLKDTSSLSELSKSRDVFYSQPNIISKILAMPEWKKELASVISSVYLHCPIHLAKEFARIDKFNWTKNMKLDELTEAEKELINFMKNKKYDDKNFAGIEYNLDIACKPHCCLKFKLVDGINDNNQ